MGEPGLQDCSCKQGIMQTNIPQGRQHPSTAHTAGTHGLPRSLDGLCPVHVGQLAQAEAVASRRIHVAIHGDNGAAGRDLEGLPDLHVHLKVGNGAPVLWSWARKKFTENR